MHRKEKEWLQGKVNGEQNHLRNEYLKARAAYSKAVKRARGYIRGTGVSTRTRVGVPQKQSVTHLRT